MDKSKFYNHMLKEEQILIKQIADLKETLSALQLVMRKYQVDQAFDIPNLNSRNSIKRPSVNTAESHVLEALKRIEKGTAHEVAASMMELYPDYTEEKAKSIARFQLSKINGEGRIRGHKILGKNSFMYEFIKNEISEAV